MYQGTIFCWVMMMISGLRLLEQKTTVSLHQFPIFYWGINKQVKKSLYNWIIQYPQVVVSPIANDYLK